MMFKLVAVLLLIGDVIFTNNKCEGWSYQQLNRYNASGPYPNYNISYLIPKYPVYRYPNITRPYNSSSYYYPKYRYKRYGSPYYSPIHYNTTGHNIFLGYPGYRDRLLYNQTIIKTSRWWSTREKIIEYPGYVPFGHVRNETITAIRIYDQGYYGSDGYARIISGGVGYGYVKIRLYTVHWNHGFRFLVQIYGH